MGNTDLSQGDKAEKRGSPFLGVVGLADSVNEFPRLSRQVPEVRQTATLSRLDQGSRPFPLLAMGSAPPSFPVSRALGSHPGHSIGSRVPGDEPV